MNDSSSAWATRLQLIRPPNLPTVPGDPLVGLLLSATGAVSLWPQVAGPVGVALLLYMGGLVLNDWADKEEDSRDRPDRPIPSGSVGRSAALGLALFLLAAGIGLAFAVSLRCAVVALILSATIVFYDLVAKRVPVLGALAMGSCRGLSVLLGWSASGTLMPSRAVWLAVAVISAYIVAVTTIAAGETQGGPVGPRRWAMPFVVVAAVSVSQYIGASVTGLVVGFVLVVYTLLYSVQLGRKLPPQHVAAAVGGLIRGLILLQLLLCLNCGATGTFFAVALLMMHVMAVALGRRFYGS